MAAQADCEVWLLDATNLFSVTMTELMEEHGLDRSCLSSAEIRRLAAECTHKCYVGGWEEFILWFLYDDDQRAKTRAVLQTNLGKPTLFGWLLGRGTYEGIPRNCF